MSPILFGSVPCSNSLDKWPSYLPLIQSQTLFIPNSIVALSHKLDSIFKLLRLIWVFLHGNLWVNDCRS